MKLRAPVLAIGAALLTQAAIAADGDSEFRIGPRIGPGEIRADAAKEINRGFISRTATLDTAGIGGTLEYSAPFGLVLEVGHFTGGETDWWDDDDTLIMAETFGSIGWQIPLGHGFSLTPRVGRARWKLEKEDDHWFDDDDDLNPAIRGYQNYWEISASKRLNSIVTLGVSHKENHYDFGRSRTTVFTAMFNLGR